MAWHEWPLIVFTVLAQTAVGAYLVLGTMVLTKQLAGDTEARLHKAMFGLWALMGMGFLASVMHLGSPLRAMNALNMLGSSWLSNEIASGSVFFALGGFAWLLTVLDKGSEAIRKGLMVGAMVVGVVFMYSMIMVYMIDTVPTWYTPLTPAAFMLTMAVSGLAFAHTLLVAAGHRGEKTHKLLPLLGVFAAASVAICIMMLTLHLGGVETSVTSALAALPDLGNIQFVRMAMLAVAVMLWVVPAMANRMPALPTMGLAFALILVAELLGRSVFYGMHLSAGV